MILVICGPTASGKSKLALEIALKFNGEIINGDSLQIYEEFNIGTAKPTLDERNKVKHHLFDFVSPKENYSVMRYQLDVRKIIEDVLKRGKLPIIVGGTGLYQKAALFDFTFEEHEEFDTSIFDSFDDEALYQKLLEIDNEAASKIHPHNRKRVIRALTIFYATGNKKSEQEAKQEHKLIYDALFIGIDMDRDTLYSKIDSRVDEMIDMGLEQEVRFLFKKYSSSVQAFQAIGYKEWIPYLKNEESIEMAINKIKQNSRNYAKRQMTYFRHQLPVIWFANYSKAYEYIEEFLKEKLVKF